MKQVAVFLLSICMVVIVACSGCDPIYKAGNLVSLDYPVETSLRSSLIHTYCDTLISKRGYNVPKKWLHENKLVEFDSVSHIRIYFKNNPEEMYLMSFGGMLEITDVYNLNIRSDGGYVARRELVPKEQEARIKQRFKNEILDTIEAMAKRNGLADSVIYK